MPVLCENRLGYTRITHLDYFPVSCLSYLHEPVLCENRLGYARITHGGLSDTEVQVGRFLIPQDKENFKDNTRLAINPNKVDRAVHFNSV